VIETTPARSATAERESVFGRLSPVAPPDAPDEADTPAFVPQGGDSGLASWAATQDEVVSPPAEPLAYPTPDAESATPSESIVQTPDVPAPAAETATPASTRSAAMGSTADRGEPLVYALPSGKPHYEGLKSSFVDFPRLLRTLRNDRHTGYITLTGEGYSGVILLNDGEVLEAICGDGNVSQGEPAFLQFRRHMDAGDGVLDVIELSNDIVIALTRLYTADAIYTGLLGRFVNLDNLLEYLAEERVDGSVVVTGTSEVGVILLKEGEVLGAYTESHRALDKKTDGVAALATERTSRIEVGGSSGNPVALDADAALNLPY
jgi:hypothetical protein